MSWTLHEGDCLDVMRSLPDGSVDAVITDPPYSSGGMVRGDRTASTKAKYLRTDSSAQDTLEDFSGDNRDQRAYGYWSALWMGQARRATRAGGIIVAFTDWRQLPSTTDAIQAGGWVWRGIVPWTKPNPRPNAGRFATQCEYAVWGSNGPLPINYGDICLPGFFEAMPPRDREHITQKPVDVMQRLIAIVPEGSTILDPFAGSGTTLVAAESTGRNSIGIEMSAHYCGVIRQRMGAIQPTML